MPDMSSMTENAVLAEPAPPAAKAPHPALAPAQPISAAAATISGNGAPKAKIATNDAAAMANIAALRSARRPSRTTACSTMASTAAFSPKNNAETKPVSP